MFKLQFDMSSDAFANRYDLEIARILNVVRESVIFGYRNGTIRDSNGHAIGQWSIVLEEDQ